MTTSPTRIIVISVPAMMVSFGSLVIFSFGAFIKPLNERFGWSRGQISLAFTLAALMGWSFDRFHSYVSAVLVLAAAMLAAALTIGFLPAYRAPELAVQP